MTATIHWTLPVPSTALLDGGTFLDVRLGRDVAIRYAYEGQDDERRDEAIVFQGVEAFKCTYYHARDTSMRVAYDQLIDCGETAWLKGVSENLKRYGDDIKGLAHLMVNFDDGPCYEFVCRSFRIERL